MIIAVAIRTRDGTIHSLPKPNRHDDVLGLIDRLGYSRPIRGEQGFITASGIFVGRRAAAVVADLAGQAEKAGGVLFSEDLW